MKKPGSSRPGAIDTTPQRLDFDSIVFRDVRYEALDDHIVIHAGENGNLSVLRMNLAALAKELSDIAEAWGDVRT